MTGRVPIPTILNRSWTRTFTMLVLGFCICKGKTNLYLSQLCFHLHYLTFAPQNCGSILTPVGASVTDTAEN
jgi:hypothetical protein